MADKLKVVIEVPGGVAECTSCPPGIEVEIIDHDNEQYGDDEAAISQHITTAERAGWERDEAENGTDDDRPGLTDA